MQYCSIAPFVLVHRSVDADWEDLKSAGVSLSNVIEYLGCVVVVLEDMHSF